MKELQIFERFIAFREEHKQVELTIEFAEAGFSVKIYKRKQELARYAQDQIVYNYAVDKDLDLAFQLLKQKIKEVK